MIGPTFPAVVMAAAGGDEDAFGMLWYDLQPRLVRYFKLIAPRAAEDLASETWVAVIRVIGRFQGDEAAFGPGVHHRRHKARDWWRRPRARGARATGLPSRRRPMTLPHTVLNDPRTTVLGSIATLRQRPGEAIVLRVVAGLEVKQVAEIMDKRPNTVRVLTHRGRGGWPSGSAPTRVRAPGGRCNSWVPTTPGLPRSSGCCSPRIGFAGAGRRPRRTAPAR